MHASDAPSGVRLRSRTQWVSGSHSRSVTQPFRVQHREHGHARSFVFETDQPRLLGGDDNGPTPDEFLLYGLGGSLVASLAQVAEERGVPLTQITAVVEGELDTDGAAGTDPASAPGFRHVHVDLVVHADAPDAVLQHLVMAARVRASAIDSLGRALPIRISLRPPNEEHPDAR